MGLKTIDGLPVFDAKKPIKLHVTSADIRNADKKKPNSCAVAKACYRELHAKEVRVHLSRVYVRTNDMNWQRYMTPVNMRQEIVAFDRGGKFAPGEYHIMKPNPAKKTGKQQGSTTNQSPKPKKKGKNREYHRITDVRTGPA